MGNQFVKVLSTTHITCRMPVNQQQRSRAPGILFLQSNINGMGDPCDNVSIASNKRRQSKEYIHTTPTGLVVVTECGSWVGLPISCGKHFAGITVVGFVSCRVWGLFKIAKLEALVDLRFRGSTFRSFTADGLSVYGNCRFVVGVNFKLSGVAGFATFGLQFQRA